MAKRKICGYMRFLFPVAIAIVVTLSTSQPAIADEVPMKLPGQAGVAQTSKWLIGVKGSISGLEARKLGGRSLLDGKVLVVPRSNAQSVAQRLRSQGRLLYAEPNPPLSRSSAQESAPDGWARGAVVSSALASPAPGSATIAVIDDFVDPNHPELAGNVTYLNTGTVSGSHGTEVASVAAAVKGNGGIFGVFPGARILSAQPSDLTCAGVAEAVGLATDARADVINLSLGTPEDCFTLRIPIQVAYGVGSVVVASAGNEFQDGNPVSYPAAWPHVLSVAAVEPDRSSAYFSSANAAVDISAPGVSIPVAIPAAFDTEDGTRDGYTLADGTSYSAPMVAGAAAWLRSARRDLTQGQTADLIRYSAIDIDKNGWDADTGWGLLNVGAALSAETPEEDPWEPNDLIAEVSGALFEEPDDFIWRGFGRRSFRAAVDRVEDPVDIYRIRLLGRRTASISVSPSVGDADLEIYEGSATDVGQRSRRVGYSRKSGRKTDTVSIRNRTRKATSAYVVVTPYAKVSLDARYRLTVRR